MAKINYDGTNIVGGPYKPYVDEQIKVRQEKLGNFNKTSEEIVWENGKSAFVALASSVNIANSKISQYIDTTGGEEENISSGEDTTDLSGYNGLTNQLVNYILGDKTSSKTLVVTENNDGEERIKLLNLTGDPQQYFGNFLARNIVLYGGTSYYTKDSDDLVFGPNYRFGITKKTNVFDDSAYGFGGTNPDGFKPMPGITSFNLKSKNMGSLRDATVTIRANSEEQFKMIDNLYCRIGYTMFLEWGNSLYFDNEGRYQKIDYPSSMIPMFLSGKIIEDGVEIDLTKDPTSFISRIETYRELSNGNYDAFFGRVKNFSWEYIAKGGYWEITLSMISWGDIVESLTIDGQFGTISELETELLTGVSQPNNSSALTSFLSIVATPEGEKIIEKQGGHQISKYSNFKRTLIGNLSSRKAGYDPNPVNVTANDNIVSLNYSRLSTSIGKIVSGHAQFANKHYYYVRFGDILDFIKDRLLLYTPNSSEPIVDIDTDTLKNICYYPGINVSADPSKVMVNNPIPYGFDLVNFTTRGDQFGVEVDWEHSIYQDSIFRLPKAQLENFGSKFDPNDPTQDFPLHGKIMNIYFEYQYLLDTIEELRGEEDSKIPLYDFINKLLQTANSCLGGVNRLSIRLEDDRVMRIYDQNSIYGTQVDDNEGATLNLYGMKPLEDPTGLTVGTEGSFVTEVNVKTELTNDFSTTVSVGAQSQGKVLGEDATGLSRWNFGLQDRYYPQKLDSLRKDNNEDKPTIQDKIEKIKEQLKFLWFGYAEGALGDIRNTGEDAFTEEEKVNNPDIQKRSENRFQDIYYFQHFPVERISNFVKLQKDWLAELIKLENELANAESQNKGISQFGTNQVGMIPINIQVTMDGLSGIRIYDRLKVDTRFLPNYYPQTLYWIIKGVSHEVVNNKWNTKLETIAVPKLPESQNLSRLLNAPLNTGTNPNSGNNEDGSNNNLALTQEQLDFWGVPGEEHTYALPTLIYTSVQVNNTPSNSALKAMSELDKNILTPITDEFGVMYITSCYRSPAVNSAIGGSTTSQHKYGEAVDFISVRGGKSLSEVFTWIADNLTFGQLIWELGNDNNPQWIHVSDATARFGREGEILRFLGNGVYEPCDKNGVIL